MKKPCNRCCSSGIVIKYVGYKTPGGCGTTGFMDYNYTQVKCPKCEGKGYIDEDEIVSVPRKYVKDEYYKKEY